MKKIALIVLIASFVSYRFFTAQPVGVYDEDGAPKTVLFTNKQCGKACDDTRRYLTRRKIDFDEHDALDNGSGSDLYEEYGGAGYLPFVAMGRQRVIGNGPGDIISALAVEFGPSGIKAREFAALQRNFDDADEPRIVMYATASCGYCKKARQYFAENGIEFFEFDIEKDRVAKRDFDTLFGSGTPLIFQGYTRVVGFDQRKIEKQFDL